MALTKNQEKFLAALAESMGVLSKAAHACNMTRQSHYVWIESSEEYRKAFDAVQEECLDFIEDSLYQRIIEGSDAVLLWVAKTRLQKRGYVEKQEIAHTGEAGIQLTVIKEVTSTPQIKAKE